MRRRGKIEAFELMSLRNISDKVRDTLMRERCGCELSAMERVERNELK